MHQVSKTIMTNASNKSKTSSTSEKSLAGAKKKYLRNWTLYKNQDGKNPSKRLRIRNKAIFKLI